MTRYRQARQDRDVDDPSMRLDDWIANEPRPVRSGGEHGRAGCPTSPQVLAEAAIKAALEGVEGVSYETCFVYPVGTAAVRLMVDVTIKTDGDVPRAIGDGLIKLADRMWCPDGGES